MGIYGDKKDYQELMKENIEKARLLYNLSEKDQQYVKELILQKEKIKEINGFWATFKINNINKKIEKIRNKYKN